MQKSTAGLRNLGWEIPHLFIAGLSAKAIANVENRLAQEASSRVGYNLLHSSDLSGPQINDLKTSLDQMAGQHRIDAKSIEQF